MNSLHLARLLFLPLLCAHALMLNTIHAADIATEVRQKIDGDTTGFLEFSSALSYFRVPIVGFADDSDQRPQDARGGLHLGLSGMLEWRGFFIEAVQESSSNGAIGYNAWENDSSRVALLLTSQIGGYGPADVTGYESVRDRDSDLQFGLRSTHYRDNNIVQLELLGDVTGRGGGLIASWQFGHFWQVRNWNAHALLGMRYFSSNTIDYYFGIDADEISALTPRYQADSGFLTSVEVGAALPINEKWVFRTAASIERLPDSVAESPLVKGRVAYDLNVGVYYVF